MRFRKPQVIPLVFIVLASVLLFGLCGWQVQRLHWKNTQIAQIQAASAQDMLGTLPQDLAGLEYRNVMLTGHFVNAHMFHLVGRPQGEGQGFFVLTPFVLEDDGRAILVNRGFAPAGQENAVEGTQTIRGILRPMRQKRLFMPANHPEKNVWFYEDLQAMTGVAGTPLLPLLVEAVGGAQKGVYPKPGSGKIALRNDHLHYAITWFLVGVAGLVMFAVYHRVPEEKP